MQKRMDKEKAFRERQEAARAAKEAEREAAMKKRMQRL